MIPFLISSVNFIVESYVMCLSPRIKPTELTVSANDVAAILSDILGPQFYVEPICFANVSQPEPCKASAISDLAQVAKNK